MSPQWRLLRLGVLAIALIALAVGAVIAHTGLSRLTQARHDAAVARERLAEADTKLAAMRRHAEWVDAAARLVEQSRALGLEPERWVERKVNLRSVSTSRQEADRLLRETANGAGRLFMAEAFEVSVLDAHDGLFDAPGPEDRGLNLTLRGSFFARDME